MKHFKRAIVLELVLCILAVCAFPCFCIDKKDNESTLSQAVNFPDSSNSTSEALTQKSDEKSKDFTYLLSVGYPESF